LKRGQTKRRKKRVNRRRKRPWGGPQNRKGEKEKELLLAPSGKKGCTEKKGRTAPFNKSEMSGAGGLPHTKKAKKGFKSLKKRHPRCM